MSTIWHCYEPWPDSSCGRSCYQLLLAVHTPGLVAPGSDTAPVDDVEDEEEDGEDAEKYHVCTSEALPHI